MKTFNLIASSLAIALIGALTICFVAGDLFGDNAPYVAVPLVYILGFSSRRIAQKLLGYTLEESFQKTPSDQP